MDEESMSKKKGVRLSKSHENSIEPKSQKKEGNIFFGSISQVHVSKKNMPIIIFD
jgi:hypothetical protein